VPCRLGIRITRGQIKLFADFLQSDIIIASPVALATKLAEDAAAAAERAAAGSSKGPARGKGGKGGQHAAAAAGGSGAGGEADFLSSIEVCVVERADVMLMQNWQHVVTGGLAVVCTEHDTMRWCHTTISDAYNVCGGAR
jgi:U3 small nucleolar RNA-associated protein 25